MRIVFPRWKVVLWTLALLVAVVVGGVWFAYAYATDSRTLAALIRAQAPRYLPGTHLDLGRVRIRPFAGEVNLNHVSVHQTIDGANFQAIRIPWLRIRHDARAMLKGKFVPREVVVTHPTLRLCRRQDGTWNLQGLLADPWPGPKLTDPPTIPPERDRRALRRRPERGGRGDPPRRLAEARPGRVGIAQVRRDGQGRRLRPHEPPGDVPPRHRPCRAGGGPRPPGNLQEPARGCRPSTATTSTGSA